MVLNYKSLDTTYIVNGEIVTIDLAHFKIHEGEHYLARNFTVLGNGDTIYFLFNMTTPKSAHMLLSLANNVEAEYNLCEDPEIVTKGTLIPRFNRNRYFSDNTNLDIYIGGDLTCGLVIASSLFGSRNLGSDKRDSNEIILNPDRTYALEVINLAIADNTINYVFDWYEHSIN